MNRHEIMTKIKENKKEIIVGGITLVALGVAGYFGFKVCKNRKQMVDHVAALPNCMDAVIEIPSADAIAVKASDVMDIDYKSAIGVTCDEAWYEDTWANLILNDFTIKDAGALGQDIMANVPGATEDTVLTAMIGVLFDAQKTAVEATEEV